MLAPDQLAGVDWDKIALVLWQAPLPDESAGEPVRAFIRRGGSAIFFPPRAPGKGELYGVRWTSWQEQKAEAPVEGWRGDEDLLAHTQSGTPLPVGQLQVRRSCGLSGGELTTLATLRAAPRSWHGRRPMAAPRTSARQRRPGETPRWRPTAWSSTSWSSGRWPAEPPSWAARASSWPAIRRGTTPLDWERVAGGEEAISTEYAAHRGVYSSGDRLLAVNRSAAEESAPVLADRRVDDLFRGLDFARVDDRAGSMASLIQEIWRMFLTAMLVAMVAEAGLCLPKRVRPTGAPS